MSSLWESNCKQNNRKGKNAKQPSPKLSENPRGLAQDPNLMFYGGNSRRTNKQISTIKRTFPFTLRSEKTAGSMTVEAALVLPLFLFFFLNLGSVMEILRLHGRLETALWEIGRETGIYGAALRLRDVWEITEENDGAAAGAPGKHTGEGAGGPGKNTKNELVGQLLSGIGDLTLSYTYVKAGIENFLGEEYLNAAPIRGGSDGLHFVGSDIVNGEDVLEMVVSYQIEPFWALSAFRPFLMENRYYGRLWTGYDVEKAARAVYYLADNGEVYHTDRSCTHLLLSVRQISWESLDSAVNERGQQYRKCSKCVRGWLPKEIWIAREGDCYHARRDCSGLKRTYRAVIWEEARNYPPCSRCVENRRK